MKTFILNIDGTKDPLPNDLQENIDGYIEHIKLTPTTHLIVNEDGRSLELPLNEAASMLANKSIYGNVIYVTEVQNAA